jgi:osmotically-inducible protein OsmY
MKLLVMGLGAAAAAFFLRDRLRGLFGGGGGDVRDAAASYARSDSGESGSASTGGTATVDAGGIDDATLARKVETEIFRDEAVPKGQINVNAQYGRVQLRGEVPNEDMLRDLVERTRNIEGVRDVESLLHLPGQEAPMHQ